jgi:outer membrane lipoprotein-sorting protein
MARVSARTLLHGVALLAAVGCGGMPRPRYPVAHAPVALARRDATFANLQSVRAEARVEQRGKQGRIRGTVLMFVERAGRVRFDVVTQFGPVAILTSDSDHFAYSDLRNNRFLTGETCPKNIARLLGVPLSAADTARFLLGGTPLIAYTSSSIGFSAAGNYLITLRDAAGQRQELELAVYPQDLEAAPERQRLYLVRSELFAPGGGFVWRVRYDKAEPVALAGAQLLLPRRVHVEQAAGGADTLISFKEIALNPRIPDDAFVQSVRPGMLEETAECD